jgi:hypothetical protein
LIEAQDIAYITGLPSSDLEKYQGTWGTYGLHTPTFLVENIPHKRWVEEYFRLIDIPEKHTDFSGQPVRTSELSDLDDQYRVYISAGVRFYTSLDTVFSCLDSVFHAATVSREKNAIVVKKKIFKIIAEYAGRADEFGKFAGEYPFKKVQRTYYQEAAFIANKLGVNFNDLAYIQRRKGLSGLRDVVKRCYWIENKEKLLDQLEL